MPQTGRELETGLWVFDRRLRILGVEAGTRMTVIRLGDGSLFLHSPVRLDAETRADLDALGPVRFVVAPNRLHNLFVAPYREAYPDAELWAAPGLPEKRRDVAFDGVLGEGAAPGWAADIDQVFIAGMPHVNEVVFLHRSSRSLLVTDLGMNFAGGETLPTRLWLRLTGLHRGFGISRFIRLLVRDRDATRASVDELLRWDFERVIVTHGIVLPRHGKRLVRASWSWLEAAPEVAG